MQIVAPSFALHDLRMGFLGVDRRDAVDFAPEVSRHVGHARTCMMTVPAGGDLWRTWSISTKP